MSTTTNTPLMNLVVPVPGPLGEQGPRWANDLVNIFNVLDSHNHSPGSGSRITPNGLNINADLTLNANNLVSVTTVKYLSQTASLPGANYAGTTYVAAGDLWFTNSAGQAVQITSGAQINVAALGTITGDYSASGAAINYNNTTKGYLFYQGTPNTSAVASVLCGNISIQEQVPGGKAVTVRTATGLSASYSFVLPAVLPLVPLPLILDASGTTYTAQLITSQYADQSVTTLKIADANVTTVKILDQNVTTAKIADANVTTVKLADQSVTTAKVADASITQAKMAPMTVSAAAPAGGVLSTASSGHYVRFALGDIQPPNLSGTLVTTGRPVLVSLAPDQSASRSEIELPGAVTGAISLSFYRNGASISVFSLSNEGGTLPLAPGFSPSAFQCMDFVGAGTQTYQVRINCVGNDTLYVFYAKLVAYEI